MTVHTLAELAARFDLEVVGDGDTRISGMCELLPGEPGKLGFMSGAAYRAGLATTQAAAVIVGRRDVSTLTTPGLVARDIGLAFARIAKLFDRSLDFQPGVHATAVVDPGAELGEGSHVGAGCVIEAGVRIGAGSYIGPRCVLRRGVQLGAGARLEASVTIAEDVRIGARILVQSGAVIGSRGFGNVRLPDGSWESMPQLGTVVIGDDVEIGANTTIDRGALGNTVIESGVRLDNLIQIAHNCVIGANTAIAACTGIAGSTKIGRRCLIAGATAINGHVTICDDVVVLGMGMVTASIDAPGIYGSGLPATPANDWRRSVARIRRLDKMAGQIKQLESLLNVKAPPSAEESDN